MWQLFAAGLPIVCVLYLMLVRGRRSHEAGSAGLFMAIAVGGVFFGATPAVIGVAIGRTGLLALFVLYIIWMALFLYHAVNEAGAIDVIGSELPKLAGGRAAQALLLAWVLGSFLQGATGFGVPAAVIAPLLVGLGFSATTAVVIALAGHGWAVTFGSLGSSFSVLLAASGMPGRELAGASAELLALCCFCCGVICLWTVNRWQSLREQWVRLLLLAVVMGGGQWLLAVNGFWNVAAFGGGFAGLIVAVVDFQIVTPRIRGAVQDGERIDFGRFLHAFTPYLLLIVVIIIGQFLLKDSLNRIVLNINFPEVQTRQGFVTAASAGRSISIFGHGGALLFYTALLTFGWFSWRGGFDSAEYRFRTILQKTVKGSQKTTIAVFTLLGMAVVMSHAGMTDVLAQSLSNTKQLFPLISPFLGALGAFMTGSNTNSNAVFATLQLETANALSFPAALILAAQTAGAAMGSILAPAKVVVGCSTVDGAEEATVLRAITYYGLVVVGLVGLVSFVRML